MANIHIAASGVFLPDGVRDNSYWSGETVASWREAIARRFLPGKDAVSAAPPGAAAAMQAIAAGFEDPFHGGRERRVAPPEMCASEMEARAASDALTRAGLVPEQIDLLLSSALLPDYMACNHACIVHDRIGLRADCPAWTTDAVCNSLFVQLQTARMYLLAGAKRVLLTQSALATRVFSQEDPASAAHGDGATALIVELSDVENLGLLNVEFHTDGSLHGAFVLGNPGKRWYEDGPTIAYAEDACATRKMILVGVDLAQTLINRCLNRAGLQPSDVDLFLCHQPTGWFRRIAQEHAGLGHAKSVDTFSWCGSVVAANLPLQLAVAEREGIVNRGDLVAVFGIASGMTACAALYRWG